MITNFFGSLKPKRRWLFKNNKLSLKIFWFQALWKPHFENKRNFWINCVCTKAFRVMAYPQGDVGIHCIPKRASTFITYIHEHLHHDIPTRGHLHHDIHTWTFASRHTHNGAFTSWHTYMNIYIMTYLHEHLHHDTPTRGHLHHDIHTWTFASWHAH